MIVNGIKLAFHDIGYKLDVTDPATDEKRTFTIEYLDLDDATAAAGQWTIEQEITNANLARNDPDVMAYIGTYTSGAAKVSMPILNRAGIFMVSPANTGIFAYLLFSGSLPTSMLMDSSRPGRSILMP